MPHHKILIPLNQSELSQKVVTDVERFFPPGDNDIVLFFITRPPSAAGFGKPDLGAGYVQLPGDEPVAPTLHPIYASQQEDSIKAHVEVELAPLTRRLGDAGYKVSIKVGFDRDPVDAILRIIGKKDIDLVAMSAHARVGMTRFFFRNIADTLSQKAKIPVLLVHPS